jgi:hypothetical protein
MLRMHFAEVDENNVVLQVIVSDSKEWCEQNLGGLWVRTYYGTNGKTYAGIGYNYDRNTDNFISPQPYSSWILDNSLFWVAPIPYPTPSNENHVYTWNEATLSWELSTDLKDAR